MICGNLFMPSGCSPTRWSNRSKICEVRDMVSRIQQSMRAMNGMLSELQDISSLNAGVTHARMATIPVTDVLMYLDNEFSSIARDRGLDLRLSSADLWVRSDPALLRRILQNLVANALAHTREGYWSAPGAW